jgi:cytochrome c oxidase cbb3-type subunit 3
MKILWIAAALLLASNGLHAADQPKVALDSAFFQEVKILVYILIFIALLIMYIAIVMSVKDVKKLSLRYIWDGMIGRNDADPDMGHDYDGIRELDNPMPAWLRLIFVGSIGFGIVYLIHFHMLKTGPLSREEYDLEIAAAAETYKSVELPEDQLVLVGDAGRLAKAGQIFQENCATCHRKDLGGESGPNLTDDYWLHGSSVKEIYATITNGVAGKSMISWKDRIPSQERLAIASFILSKQGSNPANPRPSEGVKAGEVVVTPDSAAQNGGAIDSSQVQ